MTVRCRFCAATAGEVVLDLGAQPACDHFPLAADSRPDPVYPLRLWLCRSCGLAQLAEDPTVPDEPRGVEPLALVRQADQAVAAVAAAGLLAPGGIAIEHASPHGGSWLGLLAERGIGAAGNGYGGKADLVVDSFGLMHAADQAAALSLRAGQLDAGGTLLVQYHGLAAVLAHRQWNTIRHGHPVYLSTPALVGMLRAVGLETVSAWCFDLYGGTVLLAARRDGRPASNVTRLIDDERAIGVQRPAALRALDRAAADSAAAMRAWLMDSRAAGLLVLGYGAASRAVPLLNHAGVGPDLLAAVADASVPKHGRRLPGVGIPIVAPEQLLAREPDRVVLFVPDLLDEVRERFPQVEGWGGRWVVAEPDPRVVAPAAAARSSGPAHPPSEGIRR